MSRVGERTIANMRVVLEECLEGVPMRVEGMPSNATSVWTENMPLHRLTSHAASSSSYLPAL